MDSSNYRGLPSTAAIGGHAIHSMLLAFSIVFLVGTRDRPCLLENRRPL